MICVHQNKILLVLKFHIVVIILCGFTKHITEAGLNTTNSSNIQSFETRFSHALVVDEVFLLTSFVDISVVQCKTNCFTRTDCMVVEYRVAQKYCRLFSNHTGTKHEAGFASVLGFDATTKQCGNSACNATEVCSSSTNRCEIRECGHPRPGQNITGNMFDIGARIMYNNSWNVQQTSQCGTDGQWTGISYNGITCQDIQQLRHNMTSGFYRNSLNMTIVCDFDTDGGSWLRRSDGSVDFYRDWQGYKHGFGDHDGEFWLGLENLYQILTMTGRMFDLRIDMTDWSGETRYAVYDNFSIGDESDFYRLHVGDYLGTAGNALNCTTSIHDDQPFSTFDVDQDQADFSCAEKYQGAWWYSTCHCANLNGHYYPPGVLGPYASGMVWWPLTGFYQYLSGCSMKIREK